LHSHLFLQLDKLVVIDCLCVLFLPTAASGIRYLTGGFKTFSRPSQESHHQGSQILLGWQGATAKDLGFLVAVVVVEGFVGDEGWLELPGLRLHPIYSLKYGMLLNLIQGGPEARIAHKYHPE